MNSARLTTEILELRKEGHACLDKMRKDLFVPEDQYPQGVEMLIFALMMGDIKTITRRILQINELELTTYQRDQLKIVACDLLDSGKDVYKFMWEKDPTYFDVFGYIRQMCKTFGVNIEDLK